MNYVRRVKCWGFPLKTDILWLSKLVPVNRFLCDLRLSHPMQKMSGVWVRFPGPSKSKSFRLVLLRRAGGQGLMFANRTSVQNLKTLLIFRFAPFKERASSKASWETSNFIACLQTSFPFPLEVKFAKQGQILSGKENQELRDLGALKHLLSLIHRVAMFAEEHLELCGETGPHAA